MEKTKLYGEHVQVVEAMEQGLPWHEAAKRAGLEISQSTAYRLRQRMWVRDRFFPATYAHATRASFAAFFSLARSCEVGTRGGPGGSPIFQQLSTQSRSACCLSTRQ
jgi:hypothetical protein